MKGEVLRLLEEADRESVRAIIGLRSSGASPERAVDGRVRAFQRLAGRYVAVPIAALSRELWAGCWWHDRLVRQGYRFFLVEGPRGGMFGSLRELSALGKFRPLAARCAVQWPPPSDKVRRNLAVTVADTWERVRTAQGRVLLETLVYVSNRGETAQEATVSFTAVWDPVKVVPLPAGSSIELRFEWEGEPRHSYLLSAAVYPVEGDSDPENNFSAAPYTVA
ncbi:MAG: hypothetical protein K6T75_06300 [Acetobacteraceae bacterium]|nr:hypothetical protein [Acetobacteraceae bacterium]